MCLGAQEFELYDLQSDPSEIHNLYGKPEVADLQRHLQERLDALRAAVPERSSTAS